MYVSYPSLNKGDFTEEGFKWIDADDSKHGVFSYIRTYEDESLVIVMNTLDKYYEDYALGYFEEGEMVEILKISEEPFLKAVGYCCRPACWWHGGRCPEIKSCLDDAKKVSDELIAIYEIDSTVRKRK